ncbi:hypothetical protein [Neolewinella sp.]|uniref:hypothetical protein n=1 Tax=Neolewinella sp. TaxID=2993543 RepID=UPI003B51A2FF
MKSLLFLVLFATAFNPAYAGATVDGVTNPLVARTQVKDFRLDLKLVNLQKQRTVITLQQLDGTTHYQTRIKEHNGYALSMQLRDVPAGRYLLTVKQGKVLRQQVIVKSAAGIMCSDWK